MAEPAPDRRATEQLIDEIVSQSFPASDPPAWGAVAARLRALEASAPGAVPIVPPSKAHDRGNA